jgi:hypothetical protein
MGFWMAVNHPTGFPLPPSTGLVGVFWTTEFWFAQSTIYYTPDAGSTWTAAPPHGLNKVVGLIDMVALGPEVSAWATGIGDTLYHYRRTLTGVDGPAQPLPEGLSLSQNYPNPFNSSTKIVYRVPGRGSREFVELRVFDMLGREVATLAKERKEAGVHSVQFNAEGLSGGVYICRFQAGSYVASRKMVFLK